MARREQQSFSCGYTWDQGYKIRWILPKFDKNRWVWFGSVRIFKIGSQNCQKYVKSGGFGYLQFFSLWPNF
jgi:hypothetical protein